MDNTLLFKRVIIVLLFINAGYIGYSLRNEVNGASDLSLNYKKYAPDDGFAANTATAVNNVNAAANTDNATAPAAGPAAANTTFANNPAVNTPVADIGRADTASANTVSANMAANSTITLVNTVVDHADLPCWGVRQWGKGNTWQFCWEGYDTGIWNHCWLGPTHGCWDGHDVACRNDGSELWQDCYAHYTGTKSWPQGESPIVAAPVP